MSLVSVIIQLPSNAARKTSQGRTADPNHGSWGTRRGIWTRVLYLSLQGQHSIHDVSFTITWYWVCLKISIFFTCVIYVLQKQIPCCTFIWGGGGKLHVANFERINFCESFFFDVSIFFYLKQFLVFMVYKVYLLLIIIIFFYKNSKDYP